MALQGTPQPRSTINLGWNRLATQNLSWRSKEQQAALVHINIKWLNDYAYIENHPIDATAVHRRLHLLYGKLAFSVPRSIINLLMTADE